MRTLMIEQLENGVLVSLATLVARLPELKVSHWAFRNTEFQYGNLFGIPLDDFERLSGTLKGGFIVADVDFREFLKTDFQLIDGVVEAVLGTEILVAFDCVDSTLWEVSTDDNRIIEQLERATP